MKTLTAAAAVDPVRQRTQYTCTKGINWDDAPLGKLSDGDVARMYKVARPVVCNARNRRGIPPFTSRYVNVVWDDVPLGGFPDAVLAKELGVSEPTVSRHRNQKGICPFQSRFITTEGEAAQSYPEALIDLFWHEQDIAHQFQVPIGPYVADWVVGNTVVEYAGFIESRTFGDRYRERLAVKVSFYKSQGWHVQVIYPNDLESFKPKGSPEMTRDIISGGVNWSGQPLGKMTDMDLASRLGVGQTTVSRWRNIFGIAPYKKKKRDWTHEPLGKMPDPALAARLGVSKETVRRARVMFGIPSYRSVCHAA